MALRPRRALALALLPALTAAAAFAAPLVQAAPAQAATTASPAVPVSSAALPTVQVDGVVWTQVVVGDTVYAGGSFSTAHAAGAPAGDTGTPRSDLLAYDLTTGALITSFAPTLNAQVRGLAASPDGRTVYAVGDFTKADGASVQHVVALDATTGARVASFAAGVNSTAYSVAATASTVYVGGAFTSADAVARGRAAAFSASTGATTAWAPDVADGLVRALVVSPDGSKVVLGGNFSALNGSSSPGAGLGAVDAATGASLDWNVGKTVFARDSAASIYSLASDGTNVYGTEYVYGSTSDGDLEGTFSASWTDGSITWIEDCHGDTYSVAPMDGVVYTASHAHYCGNVPGGFDQSDPDPSAATKQRALAFTAAPTGTLLHNSYGSSSTYADFGGQPAPSLLTWFPDLKAGKVTGQTQAAWSVAAGDGYVVLGGEFPTVNGTAQAGLVRFRLRSAAAPDTDGPSPSGSSFTPTAVSTSAGAVRIGWEAETDRDDAQLTYRVYRGTTLVATTTASSHGWWDRPMLAVVDTGATPGATATYTVKASDPAGNTATSAAATVTVASSGAAAPSTAYSRTVLADGAQHYWRLDGTGATALDAVGSDDLTLGDGVTTGTAGAIAGGDTAASFSGAGTAFGATTALTQGPEVFTEEAWFRTTSTAGGKIVGFGDASTGNSSNYDRHVYLTGDGRVVFGVYPGSIQTVQSDPGYADGAWHQVVATLGADGMHLYVDGAQVAARADVTSAQPYFGHWRVGGDTPWEGAADLAGDIDDVAVYGAALTADQVAHHYALGTGAAGATAAHAAFTATPTGLTAALDASASSDTGGGALTSWTWDFGDGSTGSGATTSHAYAAAGTYAVRLTVTDDAGATDTTEQQVTVAAPNRAPTAAFTATATGLTAAFDGSASTDADGSVASWAWDFGDGTTGTGAKATHAYAKAGTWTATLTVTDDRGATATVSHAVAANAPAHLAADAFGRTVKNGLGTADTGGAWTLSGSSKAFQVASGTASVTTAANTTLAGVLGSVSSPGSDVTVSMAVPALPTGGSAYAGVIGRRVGTDDYGVRARIGTDGSVQLELRHGSTTLKTATVSGVRLTAGSVLRLRLRTTGSGTTALQARAWLSGSAEPTTWQVSTTDATAKMQAAGGVGIRTSAAAVKSPFVIRFDDFTADPA